MVPVQLYGTTRCASHAGVRITVPGKQGCEIAPCMRADARILYEGMGVKRLVCTAIFA